MSGQPYSGLKKGTAVYNGNLANLAAGVSTAAGAGHTVEVVALLVMHGEADATFGTTRSQYLAHLIEWLADYTADCKAATGQAAGLVGIAHQTSVKDPCPPAHAVLDAHRADIGWICVGPIYQHQTSGSVHPDAAGTFHFAELHARVYRAVTTGDGWDPVAPIAITRTGASITVTFSVPAPPLVIDTTLFPARTHYGFAYVDDEDSASIATVGVTGPDEVTITLDGTPTGTGERLIYGPPATAYGGNLRDSETAVSTYDGAPLHNWCCYFDDPIDADLTPEVPTPGLVDVTGAPVVQYGRAADGSPVALVDTFFA